jgi:hypothetical protein
MEFKEKLQKIQCELKAPKNLYNSFGKYKYRNAEGICEAVKPMLEKYKLTLTMTDDIIVLGQHSPIQWEHTEYDSYKKKDVQVMSIFSDQRFYIKSLVTLSDCESDNSITVSALARESEVKKGVDESQITGTASSYARKYALNGLFLLDDTKDADSDEYHNQTKKDEPSEKEQKEVESIKKQKISELKVKAIQTAIANAKVDPQSVLATYKIKTFEEMTEEMFLDANKKLGKM